MTIWNKMDASLSSIYLDYLHEREHGTARVPRHHTHIPKDGKLSLALQYSGHLDEIAALGFEVTSRPTVGRATGRVAPSALEAVADHPAVIRLSFGKPPAPLLNVSVPDVNVRGKIWTITGNVFNGSTGAGVIIGVIDTGIDFDHPFFRHLANTTRILRIWDQGLVHGEPDQKPPPAALLEDPTGPTYGVEYDEGMINATVQGTSGAVRHRDCHGHGTHVASIAAGDGRDAYEFIGVAPHAKLIVVKYLYLDNDPQVPHGQRFRDAVCYILNTAKNFNMPVVINLSMGDDTTAHDGLSDEEVFLTNKFASAVGQVLVASAGNSAGEGIRMPGGRYLMNQHARLEFPVGGGSGEIRLELMDDRYDPIEYNNCRRKNETGELSFKIYYPFGKSIDFSVRLPDTTAFIAAPSLGSASTSGTFKHRGWEMRHVTESQVVGATTHRRNIFQFKQVPVTFLHYEGIYTLSFATSDTLTAHLYCSQTRRGMFRVEDSVAPPSFVHLEDRFLIGKFSGATNVLSVASYDAKQSGRPVTSSSSRGPLATYGGPTPPDKPDLTAPGAGIEAALSRHEHNAVIWLPNTTGNSGTSMAAPHVAGAAALLLSKNKMLTTADILAKLKTHVRTDPSDVKEEVGDGRLDAKNSYDHTPP